MWAVAVDRVGCAATRALPLALRVVAVACGVLARESHERVNDELYNY